MDYKGIALIPIVTALVSLLKNLGLSNRLSPLVSLFIGEIFGIVFLSDVSIKEGILSGLVIGLSASGFYSHGKEISKTVAERKANK